MLPLTPGSHDRPGNEKGQESRDTWPGQCAHRVRVSQPQRERGQREGRTTDPGRSPSAPASFINTGGGDVESWGTAALAVNTWTHLAFVASGTQMQLYANGSLVGTVTTNIPLPRAYIGVGYVNSGARRAILDPDVVILRAVAESLQIGDDALAFFELALIHKLSASNFRVTGRCRRAVAFQSMCR